MARPIEVVLARRIAWLGLSSPAMTSSQWTISQAPASAAMLGELARGSRPRRRTGGSSGRRGARRRGRRRRPSPPGRCRRPSRRLRSAARCPTVPSPCCRRAVLRLGLRGFHAPYNGRSSGTDCAAGEARRNSGIPETGSASAHHGCGACCAWTARFFSWGRPSWHLFSVKGCMIWRAPAAVVNGRGRPLASRP